MLLSLLLSLLLSQFLNLLLSLFAGSFAAVMPSSWQQLAVGDAVQRQGVQGGAKTGQIVEIEYTVRWLNMDTETFLGSEDADMDRLHSLADTWVAEVQKTKKATAARDQKTQKAKKAKEAKTGGKPVQTKIKKTETKTKTKKIILEEPVTVTYKKKVYTCCTSVPVLGERVAGATLIV